MKAEESALQQWLETERKSPGLTSDKLYQDARRRIMDARYPNGDGANIIRQKVAAINKNRDKIKQKVFSSHPFAKYADPENTIGQFLTMEVTRIQDEQLAKVQISDVAVA